MKFVFGLILCSIAAAAVVADDSGSSEETPQVRILGSGIGEKVVQVIEKAHYKISSLISRLLPAGNNNETAGNTDYTDEDVIDTETAELDNDEKGY